MRAQDLIKNNSICIQQLTYSCGPCTIINILRLKGEPSPSEEEMTKLCKSEPEVGTSNENLLDACRQVGLEVLVDKQDASIEDLERSLGKGSYVIVDYWHAFAEEGHYGLVTDYDDRAVYLIDPSFGFIRLRKQDFLKNWYNGDKTIKRWYAAVK